jgi:hypothetical protein
MQSNSLASAFHEKDETPREALRFIRKQDFAGDNRTERLECVALRCSGSQNRKPPRCIHIHRIGRNRLGRAQEATIQRVLQSRRTAVLLMPPAVFLESP